MKMNDDVTGLPINECNVCKVESVGFLDEPEEHYICEVCEKKE